MMSFQAGEHVFTIDYADVMPNGHLTSEQVQQFLHPGARTSRNGAVRVRTMRASLPRDRTMKFTQILAMTAAAAMLAGCAQTMAQPAPMASMNPMVGGMPMYASKDIVDNAVNSADHTTLVAAVKAAGLVDALKSPGPFTVFAPVNDAFNDLPAGTVAALLKPENKATLVKVLTYHVVPGALTSAKLAQMIQAGGGKAVLTTASGGMLTASMNGPTNIIITDAKGGVAHISTYDVIQSNGVIMVIDKVLLPG